VSGLAVTDCHSQSIDSDIRACSGAPIIGFVRTRIEVGLDLVEIDRIKRILERHGDRFLARVYTEREIQDSDGRTESLAARFAAKEAVMKALGTGAMDFREIEVYRDPGERPRVRLHGRARARAEALGTQGIAVSLTHSRTTAAASVTVWSEEIE
jgi:holo-[acyl-carrier protein] synthase